MKKLMLGGMGLIFLLHTAAAQEAPVFHVPQEKLAVTLPAPLQRIDTAPFVGEPGPVLRRQGDDDPMRSKTFSRSFPVDQSDKILLSNKYGEVQVKTWDKKEARVDVEIRAYSKNEASAQELLDEVNIHAAKEGDQIVFRTNVGGGNYGMGRGRGKSWRREVRIDYVLYVPAGSALNLSNQYGNVLMGNFAGPLYVKVQYGNLTAGKLMSSNNYVSVQYGKADIQEMNKAVVKQEYGSGLNIGVVQTLDLNAQYAGVNIGAIKGNAAIKQQYGSGLNIGTVGNLELDAQYTGVNIGTINGNAAIKQQYNNIKIATANKLALDCEYASVKLGTLKGDGSFRVEYNNLAIDEITTGCRALMVKADYVNISLGFSDNYQADFVVNTSYAGFKYGSNVTARLDRDPDDKSYSSTKNYTGSIGKGGTAKVSVSADYGNVTFR